MSIIDYYKILGVSANASSDDIKKSFRKMALLYHPDTAKNEESNAKFLQLQEAYDILTDEIKRKDYDSRYRLYSNNDAEIDALRKNQQNHRKPTYQGRENNATIDSKRNWDILNNLAKDELNKVNDDQKAEDDSVIDKVKTFFQRTFGKDEVDPLLKKRTFYDPGSNQTKRIYNFTISTLESLNESNREIVLEQEDKQRKVRIKIPAGITNGTILKINIPANDDFPTTLAEIRINIEADNFLDREGDNLAINIPITPFEALSGSEIEIPTTKGKIKFKIPTPWKAENKTKISGHGLFNNIKNKYGDLFVSTYVTLPEHLNQTTLQAAKLLEESFNGHVRRNIPNEIIKDNK